MTDQDTGFDPSNESTNDSTARPNLPSGQTLVKDLRSGLVVFLVALPLCLGIAVASEAPPFAGLLAGIIGGIVVGLISKSHTSVSGPAAGLTAIVIAQIAKLGSFEAFLLAVLIGGVFQIVLGLMKAGALSTFFPTSVINGLLAAIGVILILKEIPHLLGHDSDPMGEMQFNQPDRKTTFGELQEVAEELWRGGDALHPGSIAVGLSTLALMLLWNRWKLLKNSPVPAPLAVVLIGVALNGLFRLLGDHWIISGSHLVSVPVADSLTEFGSFLTSPDFSQWSNSAVWIAGATIAIVASLETLLNLEAVDKLDSERRHSPPSRELIAQGCGNVVSGLIGGLPVTSVIVRGSVNVNSGARTKFSAVFHGILLLVCVALFPMMLNEIPLAALAAILIATGIKLASPKLIRQMWSEGTYQFLPFAVTLLAIVFSDLLIGILIGLTVSVLFILNSSLRRPVRRIVETHLGGDITHIELANQVSFLNKAALSKVFNEAEPGTKLLIDASHTDYIDPDVLHLIREFRYETGPARGVKASLRGFRRKYELHDEVEFVDYSTRELQDKVTPDQVLDFLREGNRRFRTGHRVSRDLGSQIDATAGEQHPLAVVLSCIDSRVPAELIFDLGLGDIFSVRVAGNVIGTKTLASLEYGVGVSGVKLVLVMGHTRCGAVTSSVTMTCENLDTAEASGCDHLASIVAEIAPAIEDVGRRRLADIGEAEFETYVDDVAKRNVLRTVNAVTQRSKVIRKAVEAGQAKVVGAIYDVRSGEIEFLDDSSRQPASP